MEPSNLLTRFLGRFSNVFSKSSEQANTPDHTRPYISQGGAAARFVFKPRDLTGEGKPKPKAFAPELHPELVRLETSVCGMNGVQRERLWELGARIRPGLSAIAAAEVPVAEVVTVGLSCEAAPMPDFDEHGVIIGWDAENKARRMSDQQDLAAACVAVHRPPVLGNAEPGT